MGKKLSRKKSVTSTEKERMRVLNILNSVSRKAFLVS